jgi:hypothetical protein
VKAVTQSCAVISGKSQKTTLPLQRVLTLRPSFQTRSHTPPIPPFTTSDPHPSLRITDLHHQQLGSTYHPSLATPPFQRNLTTTHASYPATLPRMQRYNSCIPIASMTPSRRQGSQLSDASGRPPSFLPLLRGLTPLSIPFSNGKSSSSPSGSFSGRPGFPTVPSSELLHSMRECSSSHGEAVEDITSPFHEASAAYTDGYDNLHAQPSSSSSIHFPSSQVISAFTTAQKPNFSYPTPLIKHAHSRSTEHVKSDSMQSHLHHLRNRSNGTVITYASSAYTQITNATPMIQPVIFNDSPNSSISVNLFKPSSPYMATHEDANPPPMPAIPSQDSLQTVTTHQESGSLHPVTATLSREFRFPKPAPIQMKEVEGAIGTLKKAKRRGSGALPDMLFSRTPSHEMPVSPVTPISPEQEDMATVEDDSVIDPLELLSKEHDQPYYGELKLSSTSTYTEPERAGAITRQESLSLPGRPPINSTNPCKDSLKSSTSSFYGMAV